jgi:phosphoglycerate kinase
MDDLPLDGKRVLVRVDMNVSVGDDGKVDASEDYRIEAALPTIEELMQRRCKVILVTHRGEPLEKNEDIDLTPIHRRLQELLKEEVRHTRTLFGDDVGAIVDGLEPGGVVLLPNVRIDQREEKGNTKFAEQLAKHADVFVNEAFSVSHRAHTSVAFMPQQLQSCAGRRTVIEVNTLDRLRLRPERPYVALVSGAKIQTKVGMLYDLLEHVDTLCVGGQLANVFLAALGKHPTEGWFTVDDTAAAQRLLDVGSEKLVLPTDVVIGPKNGADGMSEVSVDAIPADLPCACDIGSSTVQTFIDHCRTAKTIMWNGPMGLFEVPAYAKSTLLLARELAGMSAFRVVGGGDTVNALERERLVSKFDHVSVGGGAMVAFLEGKPLPGLEPLYE